eukprot:TRINITY_DN6308_c0_g2_i1.p1 TRINITY_DN6308_c0_g2~~TRINITY_DN6308_c0_g2_i1.p1  ORF type:complete len:570 (+),score=58.22 TRINITY_DN6308_c0_g2_i1:67-1776(+)
MRTKKPMCIFVAGILCTSIVNADDACTGYQCGTSKTCEDENGSPVCVEKLSEGDVCEDSTGASLGKCESPTTLCTNDTSPATCSPNKLNTNQTCENNKGTSLGKCEDGSKCKQNNNTLPTCQTDPCSPYLIMCPSWTKCESDNSTNKATCIDITLQENQTCRNSNNDLIGICTDPTKCTLNICTKPPPDPCVLCKASEWCAGDKCVVIVIGLGEQCTKSGVVLGECEDGTVCVDGTCKQSDPCDLWQCGPGEKCIVPTGSPYAECITDNQQILKEGMLCKTEAGAQLGVCEGTLSCFNLTCENPVPIPLNCTAALPNMRCCNEKGVLCSNDKLKEEDAFDRAKEESDRRAGLVKKSYRLKAKGNLQTMLANPKQALKNIRITLLSTSKILRATPAYLVVTRMGGGTEGAAVKVPRSWNAEILDDETIYFRTGGVQELTVVFYEYELLGGAENEVILAEKEIQVGVEQAERGTGPIATFHPVDGGVSPVSDDDGDGGTSWLIVALVAVGVLCSGAAVAFVVHRNQLKRRAEATPDFSSPTPCDHDSSFARFLPEADPSFKRKSSLEMGIL